MQTQDPKGAPAVLGGLVTPNPSGISMGHPECPGRGPAPGAPPELGRVMGGTELSPQCCWAGSPCGRCFTKEGTNQQPQERWLCPPAPWGALQGQSPGSSTDLEVPKSSWGDAVSRGFALFGVPSTPQHQAGPNSELTCFSSIIHILESPGRNYRKLRLFQTLSARQVKSSHTKQGNQNLQH